MADFYRDIVAMLRERFRLDQARQGKP